MKFVVLLALVGLGGCTVADRNMVAVSLCQRTAGCTVTRDVADNGPPQVRAMQGSKPVSKTTEK